MPADDIDNLITEITVDAYGEDEQSTAFLQAFTDEVDTPVTALVLGTEIEVIGFDYHDERHGIVAACRRDGAQQELAAADLIFPPDTPAAWIQAAYRRWLGLKPHPHAMPSGWTPSW